MPDNEYIQRLTRDLMDRGRLIEAGWIALRYMSIPLNASQVQIDEMRSAFFAGAQHLYASMIRGLDQEAEPTPANMRRMELINKELLEFIRDYELRHGVTKGSA